MFLQTTNVWFKFLREIVPNFLLGRFQTLLVIFESKKEIPVNFLLEKWQIIGKIAWEENVGQFLDIL